jgi:hypothetical protein
MSVSGRKSFNGDQARRTDQADLPPRTADRPRGEGTALASEAPVAVGEARLRRCPRRAGEERAAEAAIGGCIVTGAVIGNAVLGVREPPAAR